MGLLDARYPRSETTFEPWEKLSDSVRQDEARRMEVYAAMIDILDQNVGRVIDYLKETGHWDNTLFMFLSDNGASAEVVELGDGLVGAIDRWSSLKSNWANVANTPFRFFKNYSYEGGIITPFIAHWPSGIADAGRIDHTLLHFVDFMPTLIELAGGIYPDKYRDKALPDLPGKSMLPLFRKNEIHRLEPLYFDWANGGALRTNQWKIVRQGDDWELYDMEIDRTETTNLAGSMPEKLHELEQKWQEWNSRF
jgi:arylsulfatase